MGFNNGGYKKPNSQGNGGKKPYTPKIKVDYVQKNDKPFVNPYNFIIVDLENKNTSDVTKCNDKLFTGVLNCKLITKTPLAVPDAETMTTVTVFDKVSKKEIQHSEYKFYSRDGRLAIPGSSVRGTIRSMYEALTDSCFVTSKEGGIITARSNDAFKPGVLIRREDGKWELYSAERYIFKVNGYNRFDRDKQLEVEKQELHKNPYIYGRKVYFLTVTTGKTDYSKGKYIVGKYVDKVLDDNSKNPKALPGYMYIGESFSRKHFESIFYIDNPRPKFEITEDSRDFKGLEESYNVYNDPAVNRSAEATTFYRGFEKAKKNGAIPLWYKVSNDGRSLEYLSLACLGRFSYRKNMGELLGKKRACESRNCVCPACAIFGMVSDGNGIGSRVRITEAVLDEGFNSNDVLQKATLRELGSPKVSYAPFYGNQNTDVVLHYDDDNAAINGRKVYWHNTYKYYVDNRKTKRNATMELVNPGVTFSFKVYYDRITKEQLESLMWSLTLGENNAESSRCYKLGQGKPIGLGSSKLIIESKVERNCEDGYKVNVNSDISFDTDKLPELFSRERVEDILIISDMGALPKTEIRYPYIYSEIQGLKPDDNKVAAHQWFTKNYKMGSKSSQQTWKSIKAIKDGKRLYAYQAVEKQNDNKRY